MQHQATVGPRDQLTRSQHWLKKNQTTLTVHQTITCVIKEIEVFLNEYFNDNG